MQIKDLLDCHGREFTATYLGHKIVGKISIHNNSIFLCQNVIDGSSCIEKFGYLYSFVMPDINMVSSRSIDEYMRLRWFFYSFLLSGEPIESPTTNPMDILRAQAEKEIKDLKLSDDEKDFYINAFIQGCLHISPDLKCLK